MRIGIMLDAGTRVPCPGTVEEYAGLARLAEEAGFTSLWLGESHPRRAPADHLASPLLLLARLAPETSLSLGTGVTLAPTWSPLRLAYDATVLDHLTEGRLTLGIGLGPAEVRERYGVAPDVLGDHMDEWTRALTDLLGGGDGFDGAHVRASGPIWPPPAREGGVPLWVGGRSPRTIRRAARWGHAWYGGGSPTPLPTLRDLIPLHDRALVLAGRQLPSRVACNRLAVLADTTEEAVADAWPVIRPVLDYYERLGVLPTGMLPDPTPGQPATRPDPDLLLVGTPEDVLADIARYAAAGVTDLHLRLAPGGLPLELARRSIRLSGERLLPRLPPTAAPPTESPAS